MTGLIPILRRVWTMTGPDGGTIVEGSRFEEFYLIGRGQTIYPVQQIVRRVGDEQSTMTARMVRCGIAGAVPVGYFRPEGIDINLWDHRPRPANL